MLAAREAVHSLDKAVSSAKSYREKASRLLEEAHRALGRLEQVGIYISGGGPLMVHGPDGVLEGG